MVSVHPEPRKIDGARNRLILIPNVHRRHNFATIMIRAHVTAMNVNISCHAPYRLAGSAEMTNPI